MIMNQTNAIYPDKTLHQWFEEQVQKTPHHTAIMCHDNSLTYAELNTKANQVSHYLKQLNVKPDTLIAICLDRSINLIVGILAILKAGAAYVPLDNHLPTERLDYIIANSQASIVITQLSHRQLFPESAKVVCWEGLEHKLSQFSAENPLSISEVHHLAYAIYTSGSTGKPKGVMIEHRSICNTLHHFQHQLNIQSFDRWLNVATVTFDPSVLDIFLPLVTGATVLIAPPKAISDPEWISSCLTKHNVTFMQATPATWKLLLYHQWEGRPDLTILTGGEALTKELATFLVPKCKQLWNLYGPTEISIWATTKHIQDPLCELTVGKPIANTELYIVDENQCLLPAGEVGELYIGGKGLARGYLNKMDLTNERFIPNPFSDLASKYLYKTGDLCVMSPEGDLKIIGRLDHQVKIRGFRVELGEIEAVIKSYIGIREALVIATDADVEDKQLIAYYTETSLEPIHSAHLRDHVKRFLPDYMIPAAFVRLDHFPLNANGKLDRHALPKPTRLCTDTSVSISSSNEEKIKNIWSQVLKIDIVNTEDNFFELGGNSLHCVKILAEIKNYFHKEISISEFYHSPTIGGLAQVILYSTHEVKPIAKYKSPSKINFLSETQYNLWMLNKFYPLSTTLNIVNVRRLQGKLDGQIFKEAVHAVLKKYPILSLHISRYFPIQYHQEINQAPVAHYDLQNHSQAEQEKKLQASLIDLKSYRGWKKGSPLLLIRHFDLGNDLSELHFCVSHIISDLTSIDIIYSDLSYYYTHKEIDDKNIHYLSYRGSKASKMHSTFKRDKEFWQNYNKDASLFAVPFNVMMKSMECNQQICETIIPIPEKMLSQLQLLCNKNNVNITAALSASVALALEKHGSSSTFNSRTMTFVRGRMNAEEESIVGNFTDGSVMKFSMGDNPTLIELAKRIHQSVIDTEKYQSCFSCVKHATHNQYSLKNRIIYSLMKNITFIYLKCIEIFYRIKPDFVFFKNHCRWLASTYGSVNRKEKTRQEITVSVNILKDFLIAHEEKLFGYPVLNSEEYVGQGITILNSLMLVFFRNQNQRYLRIHGNFTSEFRELLGHDILIVLATQSVCKDG